MSSTNTTDIAEFVQRHHPAEATPAIRWATS
jgi:hypothetical protein